MKIRSIETIPVQVPIDPQRAIRGGRGSHTVSPFLLIKIHTDEAIVGLGEVSCTPVWSGEDQVTAAHFINTIFAPLLIGQDPTQINALLPKLHKAIAANPFTKAGLEMALWDILGKVAGLPLYQLLGGALQERVTTKFSVSGVEPPRAAAIAEWAVAQGFRTLKVKVGLGPEGDVARVRAVREAVGPDVRLGVDANGGWTPQVAIQTIAQLRAFDIYFAEQPVADRDVSWLADVRRNVGVPIMADESVYTVEDALAIVRQNAADALSLYVGKGGLTSARSIATVAGAAGLTCTVGSNLELGIANAAMIHLALATPAIDSTRFPCDILSPFYYESDLLTEPLPIHGGYAEAPTGPGLGVTLDDDLVTRYRTDR